ncbi:tumor protein D52 [Leptopilina boulardi]|uniref:tumor protein D52 n=1 Tax=Leptopilina boulardi TaxID=63433 RepID=UPI0021F66F36|nr:tumor protein D52 [Leptopilina boulardi]
MSSIPTGEDASLYSSGSLNSVGSVSPSTTEDFTNELQGLSPEERERQKEEWSAELAKVEEEIQTLRHVLSSKVRVSHELKRKLGISVWRELSEDVNQGLRNVKESHVFQKTESVFKSTAEKTTSILGGFGSGLSMKLGQMRNSNSFRSLEEKVGSAYENVKTKVVPSRSNSTQGFDEALREAEASRRSSAASNATSPTDKTLS